MATVAEDLVAPVLHEGLLEGLEVAAARALRREVGPAPERQCARAALVGEAKGAVASDSSIQHAA